MKKYLFSIIFLLVSYVGFSQKGLSYQAVILDPTAIEVPGQDITGQPFVNGDVWMKFSIYNGSTLQFEEVQKTKTDGYGLVNLMIGSVSTASFNALVWDASQKTLQVHVSFNQGSSYIKVSEQKLTYSPYTLFAETAGKLGDVLAISGGGTGARTATDARLNLGLDQVNNTSDATKPISTATKAALDLKASVTDVNAALALKANTSDMTAALAAKADTGVIKSYVDTKLASGNFTSTQSSTATITDADANTKGKIQLAGDLAGTAAAPTVPGLNLKANAADVNRTLALKANTADVTLALAAKADTAYVLTKVAAVTIVDADANTKGKIQLAGDLAGTAAAPTIPGLALKANAADLVTLTSVVSSNTASITANSTAVTTEATTARAAELVLTNNVAANTASITANTNAILLKAPIASPIFTGTVAIGTANPSSAAALDITSTSKGLLLPRLTFAQKSAIISPEAGLILWCSDCGTNGELQVYNGTNFVNMVGANAQFALPTISATSAASAITSSALTSGGSIDSDGGAFVTARGVVWNTSTNPTVSLSTKTTDGTGIGTFSSSISGLTSGVTYYVRAYATNSVGTKYGPEITVNTAQAVATLASTTAASSIGATSANSGGNITYNGGATVTVSGLVWSTSSNPTIALTTKTSNGSSTGTFTSNITGLTPGTLYYVRSYATNNVGTSYGAEMSFTTLNTPTISSTTAASSITSSSAISGGTISADGGDAVTTRGIVYGTSAGSSTYSVTSGSGTGTFTSNLTGLTPATTYYVRSFATNSVGTVYGTEISFTTIAIAPTLSTTVASSITRYAAVSGASISSNGGSAITSSGICWSSTNTTPTTSDSKTTDGSTSGTFTSSMTGLTAGTTYYVRAYATNGIGTSYGPVQSFTTSSSSSANPVLATTTSATSITSSSAILGGNVTDEGATQVSARGLVYGTTTGSSTFSVTIGSGAGTFTSTLAGLSQGTTYYVRSFATNTQGTSYGAETSFTTQTTPTVSVTTTPSSLTTTSAVGGGTISSSGGATITTSGLVWDTSSNPTIAVSTKTTDGATSGTFTSSITGLTQGTTYHVRAYATNYLGTSYGPNITFTTLTTPTISATASVLSITGTSATTGGTITSDGGATVTSRGVVYGTTTGSSTFSITSGTGTGTYTISLTGLLPASTYYIRSFATNSVGTVYGTETSFTTNANAPTLTTTAASSITKYAASAGGTITSNGGSVITESGICWSTAATPTTSDSKTADGTTSGTFTSSITGLTAGTTYFVRAYATNAIGTSYGAAQSFTTLSTSSNNPALDATTTATSITANSATLGGNITDEGATQVSARGLVYGTTTGSSTFSVTVGSGAGTFTSTLTGLTQGATYYVRSFATNAQGTSYGAETSFTTQTTPTVSVTATPTSITTTSAIGGGTISSTGGATITTSGLVWDASTNPTIALSTKTSDGTTSGTFTSSITGLTQGATYHVRAYATNYLGTSYGPDVTFTTVTTPTFSATATVTSITGTTATSGGTITVDGGASVTSRGIVWGTNTGSSTYSVTSGTGTGTYTSSLTGLSPATTYFVRSFATNSVGTVYGTEISFTTSAGPASKAMITTQPSGATAGTAFTTQPVVRITDSSGNTVTTSTVNVVASIASGTGTLSGTSTVAAVNGIATFTNLVLSGATGNFTLAFTPTLLTAATSNSFALSFGTASKAMITTHPSGAVNGVALTTQPVIRVTDASGNTVTTSTVSVVASIASGSGTLNGTTTVAAVNGVATFTDLVLSGTPGNFTLSFTPTSLTAVTSSSFALSVGAASKVMITTQPAGAFNGIAFSTQPIVKITDAGGNTITSSTANVVATIASGSGTLTGTTTVAAVNGVATFTNLKITGTGNHTLTFTAAGGLTAATTNTLNVAELGCAQGGACAIGETGPGGGTVFYYSAAGFSCGPAFSNTCYYLEVAPKTWYGGSADPSLRWDYTAWSDENHVGYPNLVDDPYPNVTAHINASEIGLGYKSSVYLVNYYGNNSDYAAGAARGYTGGGKTDWYLGTSVEMNLLADWAKGNPSTPLEDSKSGTMIRGDFSQSSSSATHYWTASQLDWAKENAYRQDFLNNGAGGSGQDHKSFERKVRPIRAF
jgi:hypothetical protein